MRTDLLQGHTNVFRFPVELRAPATLDLLRDLAPDVRHVLNVAESYDLSVPGIELRDMVDAETAEHIVNHLVLEHGARRRLALDELQAPLVQRAVDACRQAYDRYDQAVEAQARVQQAAGRNDWTRTLEEKANDLMHQAAEALVAAHVAVEQAEGAARAIDMARRGECWVPRNAGADMMWLCDVQVAQRG